MMQHIFYLHQNLNLSDDAGIYACIYLENFNGSYYDVAVSSILAGYSLVNSDNSNYFLIVLHHLKLFPEYLHLPFSEVLLHF